MRSLVGLLVAWGLDDCPRRGREDACRPRAHHPAGLQVGLPHGCWQPDRDVHGHDQGRRHGAEQVAEVGGQHRPAEGPAAEHDANPAGPAAVNPHDLPAAPAARRGVVRPRNAARSMRDSLGTSTAGTGLYSLPP